ANLLGRHAEDMSHMCFGETVKVKLGGMLSTHPPVDERIKAIDPQLLPRLKARWRQRVTAATTTTTTPEAAQGFAAGAVASAAVTATAAHAGAVKSAVGTPTPAHTECAHQLHQSIPEDLQTAAHDPQQAEALLYALVLMEMRSHGQESLQLIGKHGVETAQHAARLYKIVKASEPALRLPLLDITLATLRGIDAARQDQILATLDALIHIDERVTLSEFIISYLSRQLLNPPKRSGRPIKSFAAIESSLAILFSAIAQSSGDQPERQADNFQQIIRTYS